MANQKILSSKKVFSAKLFDVDEVEVEFENGIKATHHIVQRRPAVYIFALTDKNELYFVREFSYVTNDIVLQVPAGFVEEGENALKAAQRELEEETGIVATQWESLAVLELAKSSLNAKAHLFLAKGLEIKIPKPEETEEIFVVKMSLNEAVSKVLSGKIRKAAVVAGIMILDKLRQQKRI